MTTVEIIDATPEHIEPLAALMDGADRGVKLARGLEPSRVLRKAFGESCYCRVALVDGEIAGMWGLGGTLLASESHVWLTLTPKARARGASLIVSTARDELRKMFQTRDRLFTTVAAEDRRAVRWLQFWGFDLGEPNAEGLRYGWLNNPWKV
ncbi:MAG: hypothetical protein ABI196_00630 [Bradyrhizobium sp.]